MLTVGKTSIKRSLQHTEIQSNRHSFLEHKADAASFRFFPEHWKYATLYIEQEPVTPFFF